MQRRTIGKENQIYQYIVVWLVGYCAEHCRKPFKGLGRLQQKGVFIKSRVNMVDED